MKKQSLFLSTCKPANLQFCKPAKFFPALFFPPFSRTWRYITCLTAVLMIFPLILNGQSEPVSTKHLSITKLSFDVEDVEKHQIEVFDSATLVYRSYDYENAESAFWNISVKQSQIPYRLKSEEGYVEKMYFLPNKKDPIFISKELFKLLPGWQNGETPITEYLLANRNEVIRDHELLSFIQRFQYQNLPFIDDADETQDLIIKDVIIIITNPFPDTFVVNEDDLCDFIDTFSNCICNLVFNISADQSPHFGRSNGDFVHANTYVRENPKPNTHLQWDLYHKGPAVNMNLHSWGKHTDERQRYSNSGEDIDFDDPNGQEVEPDRAVNYAIISTSYYCTYACEGIPAACACNQPLSIRYDYDTRLAVQARKRSGSIWSKGAEAMAENAAILSRFDQSTNTFEILDAELGRSQARCSSSWNPNWWTEAADVVFAVLGTIENNFSEEEIRDLIDELTMLLSTPFQNTEGCVNDDPLITDRQLLHGVYNDVIHPGEEKQYYLHSFVNLSTRGYGKWEAQASVISDYYLACLIRGTKLDLDCCMPNTAQYIMGNYNDAPNPQFDPFPQYYASSNSKASILSEIGQQIASLSIAPGWRKWTRDPFSNVIRLETDTDWDHTNYVEGLCEEIVINPSFAPPKDEEVAKESLEKVSPIESSMVTIDKIQKDAKAQPKIVFVPNPFDDNIIVSFENKEAKEFQLQIFDSNGNRLANKILSDGMIIQSDSWQSGLYIFRIVDTETGVSDVHKLIKN